MPPSQSTTSHDVARLAGVSQPTVSRALRDDPRLSEETRRRVRDAATQLRYVPSQRGRSLAMRSTGQVGIVVSDLGNSFYLEVLDRLHSELRAAGRRMLVLTPDGDGHVSVDQLVDGSLDGVILTTTLLDSTLPQELGERGLPFVLLNREVDDCPGDVCVVNNEEGGSLAAQELLSLGHTEIAAIFGPASTSTGRDREAGFRRVLERAGRPMPERRWRRCQFDFLEGHRAALELLDADRSAPTALFASNDVIALGAFNALRGRQIRIPEQISLIGFDDVLMADWEVFGLTTISQDIPGLVKSATSMLLSRIGAAPEAAPGPRRVVLEPALIRRGTLGAPPGD
jgi:LacI family transcriptional regulator